jgi:hypothetical protein
VSNELVPFTPGGAACVSDVLTLGKMMAESGFFADARAAAQAVVKILAGRELGFGPVQSMTGINVIKGRISFSAGLIAAAIRRSGRYDYAVRHHDDLKCEVQFSKDGKALGVSTFTMDDARKAGLAGGDNWRKYPRNMLFARAMSNGARWFCPDVFGGPVYTPDELGAAADAEEGAVIEEPPRPAKVKVVQMIISPEQQDELKRLVLRKGAGTAKLLSYYNVGSLADLTPKQHDEAVGVLCKRPDVPDGPQGALPAGGENKTQEVG